MKTKKNKKVATLKQYAKHQFEAIEPWHRTEINRSIDFHANIMKLAFGILTKSKGELVEMWQNPDIEDANMKFVDQIRSTKKWAREFEKVMEAAATRMTVAASTSIVKKQKAA